MDRFTDELSKATYRGNVIVRVLGHFFSIRKPDGGLSITRQFDGLIQSLVLNPTQIDIRRVSSTIATFSFKLVDRNQAVTNLVQGNAASILGSDVDIWIGRSGVEMDFSDYFKLPTTRVVKLDYADGAYSFSTSEQTDRINRPIYQQKTRLEFDIDAMATVIDVMDDISTFPASGLLYIGGEVVSYSARDLVNRRFQGCIRGVEHTTPVAHNGNTDVALVEVVEGNPVDVILKVLLSGGGGSQYDALFDGCAISQSLIDIAGIEALRDEEFTGWQVKAYLHEITNALKYIEEEFLTPLRLRFSVSNDSKLTLKQVDRIALRNENSTIDNDTIRSSPKWSVESNRIVNILEIEWDYDEESKKYLERGTFEDSQSIEKFGKSSPLTFRFKAVRADLGGNSIVEKFSKRFLSRLSLPTPEITLSTSIDKSLIGVVDKVLVDTTAIPHVDGSLNFSTELEVVSRSINYMTGDVQFRLAYTSSTLNRWGFIAPADSIVEVIDQRTVRIAAGRGAFYASGYGIRLWNNETRAFLADRTNEIRSVSEDVITFKRNFSTPLVAQVHKLRFCDYAEASLDQKKYAFINKPGEDFRDGKPRYKISL